MEEKIMTRYPDPCKSGVNLEARGLIERVPKSRPQRLRLVER